MTEHDLKTVAKMLYDAIENASQFREMGRFDLNDTVYVDDRVDFIKLAVAVSEHFDDHYEDRLTCLENRNIGLEAKVAELEALASKSSVVLQAADIYFGDAPVQSPATPPAETPQTRAWTHWHANGVVTPAWEFGGRWADAPPQPGAEQSETVDGYDDAFVERILGAKVSGNPISGDELQAWIDTLKAEVAAPVPPPIQLTVDPIRGGIYAHQVGDRILYGDEAIVSMARRQWAYEKALRDYARQYC